MNPVFICCRQCLYTGPDWKYVNGACPECGNPLSLAHLPPRRRWATAYRHCRMACAGYTDLPEAKTSMAAIDARRRVGRPRPKYSPGDPHAWLTLAGDLRRQPRASWASSHLNTYGWVLSKVREIRSTLRHTLPA